MNNVFFIIFSFAFVTSVSAQKLKHVKVPAAARAAFEKENPGIKGTWEKKNGDYKVVYKKDGKMASEVINKDGLILETETKLSVSELPASIQTYIKKHKNSKVKEAEKVTKADGSVRYEIVVNKKEIVFDSNGKILKTKAEQ